MWRDKTFYVNDAGLEGVDRLVHQIHGIELPLIFAGNGYAVRRRDIVLLLLSG